VSIDSVAQGEQLLIKVTQDTGSLFGTLAAEKEFTAQAGMGGGAK
jgi:hypothetical protein